MPEITELSVAVCSEQQGTEMLASAAFAFGESADNKLLLGRALIFCQSGERRPG
jgi:hypothetical protein